MKKKMFLLILSILLLVFVSCGKNKLKEGKYEGMSKDSYGGTTTAIIHINSKGKIENVEMILKDQDGKIKDESYGSQTGEANFKLAQDSIISAREYPKQFLKTQDITKVDAIAGATSTYNDFVIAVNEALKKAK